MGGGIWLIALVPLAILYIIDQELGTDTLGMFESYFENNPELVEQLKDFSVSLSGSFLSIMRSLGLM